MLAKRALTRRLKRPRAPALREWTAVLNKLSETGPNVGAHDERLQGVQSKFRKAYTQELESARHKKAPLAYWLHPFTRRK